MALGGVLVCLGLSRVWQISSYFFEIERFLVICLNLDELREACAACKLPNVARGSAKHAAPTFFLLLEQHFQRRLLRALRSFADQYIVHLQKSCDTLTIDLKSD